MKLTKDNDVDIDAVTNYCDSAFQDEDWKQKYKQSAKKCYQDISANISSLETKYEAAPFNLTKDLCNIRFMAMMTCVQLQAFFVSETEIEN